MIDVFVVAASGAVRRALRRLAEGAGVRIAGEGDSLAALDGLMEPPDVAVLQHERLLRDPVGGRERPAPAVVVLTDATARAAARLGATDARGWAVIPADAGASQVYAAILASAAGLTVLPTTASAGVADLRVGHEEEEGDTEGMEALTPREREVLEHLARGLSNRAIGARLGISEHTAKFHVASVLAKLGAGNRAEAVRRGLRRGLVSL